MCHTFSAWSTMTKNTSVVQQSWNSSAESTRPVWKLDQKEHKCYHQNIQVTKAQHEDWNEFRYNVWLSCSDPRCGWTDHHRCPDKADLRTKEGDCFCLWKEGKEGRVHPDSRLSQFPHRSKETVKGTRLCFQDMISALKGALSGSLESVILGLMKSTTQYDASEIRGAIKVKEMLRGLLRVNDTRFNWRTMLPSTGELL